MRGELVNVCYSLGRADEVFDNEKYTFCLEIIHSNYFFVTLCDTILL